MDALKIQHYGDALYESLRSRTPVEPLTDREPGITIDDAYQIQLRMISRRIEAGETVIGKKIGVTSQIVMDMLGVNQPDFGHLLSGMVFNEGEPVDTGKMIAPKAEAEVAFVLARDLCGPGVTAADVSKLIKGFASGETAGPVAAKEPVIDALFGFDRMEDIVAALKRDGSEFALATLKTLNEKSPRGMVVTLRLLRLARTASSLEECLVREYRAACEVFRSDDFREGVRAAVIDKDRNPTWSPPRVEDVTQEMLAPYLAEIGPDELKFN